MPSLCAKLEDLIQQAVAHAFDRRRWVQKPLPAFLLLSKPGAGPARVRELDGMTAQEGLLEAHRVSRASPRDNDCAVAGVRTLDEWPDGLKDGLTLVVQERGAELAFRFFQELRVGLLGGITPV